MNKKGFSLMELILVIVIMGILVGAMLPMFSSNTARAREAKAKSEMDAIKSAVLMYRTDTGAWPVAASANNDTGAGLIATDSVANWNGPYMDAWGNDPWASTTVATPYVIRSGAASAPIRVFTYGADRTYNNKCSATCVCDTAGANATDDLCLVITPNRG